MRVIIYAAQVAAIISLLTIGAVLIGSEPTADATWVESFLCSKIWGGVCLLAGILLYCLCLTPRSLVTAYNRWLEEAARSENK